MPVSFDYAMLRVVPRVEHGEFVNAGVVLFSLERKFLGARIQIDEVRLKALWPEIDTALVRHHLESFPRLCSGDCAAGPIAALTVRERFHWLVAPRSTLIQVSPVHSGICDDPAETLQRLFSGLFPHQPITRTI